MQVISIMRIERWKGAVPFTDRTGALVRVHRRPEIVSRFPDLLCRAAFIELNNAFYTRQGRTRVIIQAKEMRKGLASVRKGPPVATAALHQLSSTLITARPCSSSINFHGGNLLCVATVELGLHTWRAQCQLDEEERACENGRFARWVAQFGKIHFFSFSFFFCDIEFNSQ